MLPTSPISRVAADLYRLIKGGALAFSPMSVGMDVSSGVSKQRLAEFRKQAKVAVLGYVLNYPLEVEKISLPPPDFVL